MSGITLIGSSFGAVSAIRALRKRDARVPINVLAPKPELVYNASLIWVPTGLRRGNALRVPLQNFFARHNVRFVAGRARGLEEAGRHVLTDDGQSLENDGLIIASGARHIKKLPGIEHALTICDGIEAAEAIQAHLQGMSGGTIAFGFASNPDEPTAVRGGPMFELLFGIETWLRRSRQRGNFRLVFFSPALKPGERLGTRAVDKLLAEMQRRGIETHLGHKLVKFDERAVHTEGGSIAADLILFIPGLTGPAWVQGSGLPLSAGGFVRADAQMRVPGFAHTYVVGDAGSHTGPDWMPKQAHMADLQGVAAAVNLLDELAGKAPTQTAPAELICIVDSLDAGTLVYRNEQRSLLLRARLLHQAKRWFERRYISALRG
jgi:sulfide:quinone oxidoreductase